MTQLHRVTLGAIKRKRNGDVAVGAELVLPDAAARRDDAMVGPRLIHRSAQCVSRVQGWRAVYPIGARIVCAYFDDSGARN